MPRVLTRQKTIATGDGVGEVKLWDIATGECLKTTKLVENQPVFSLSFSADGNTLATNQQGKGVKLWDLESGDTELLAMPSIAGLAPCFSDDGRYMATSKNDGEAVVWDRPPTRSMTVSRIPRWAFRRMDVTRGDRGVTRERWRSSTQRPARTDGKRCWGPRFSTGGLAFSP